MVLKRPNQEKTVQPKGVLARSSTDSQLLKPKSRVFSATQLVSNEKALKSGKELGKISQKIIKSASGFERKKADKEKVMDFGDKRGKTEGFMEKTIKNKDIEASVLSEMIVKHGEYPEKYRVQIWKSLLKVPNNTDGFEELVKKGLHPAMENIKVQFPLKDTVLAENFSIVMSALSYWAPILADADFVPAIVFPFVKLSNRDFLSAFELSMSLICNWLYTWFENFPNPPIKYLLLIEDLIKTEEPKLFNHLKSLNLTCSSYIWPILKYLFTQVMTKEEFCIMVDHLFTRFSSPNFLISISAAYILYYQSTLRSIKNTKDLQGFFVQQNPLNVKKLMKLAISLLPKTSKLECRIPISFNYPVFSNYPDFSLSLQVAIREKIVKQNQEVQSKRKYINDVKMKFDKMREDEAREAREQKTLIQAESEKRKVSVLEEKIRLEEKQKVDLETRRWRLAEIQKLEDTIEKSLKSQEMLKKKEIQSIEEELNMHTISNNYYHAAKKEEENLGMLEYKAAQRLLELMRVRNAEESMRKLKLHAQHWEREQEQREKMLKSAWEIENEQRRIDLEMAKEAKLKELEMCKEYNNKRRMDVQQHLKTLERELRTMELEKERQLRLIAEEELLRNEEYLTQLKLKQELLCEQEERDFQKLLNQEKEYKAQKNEELINEIRLEQQKQAMQLEKQREENEKLERQLESKAVNDKIFQMRQESEYISQEKEKMIQETLRKIESEKNAQRYLQEQLEYKKKEINERNAYQKVVRDNVDEAIQKEREDLMHFKEEIYRENEKIEYERKKMHERKMNEIARQREQALNQITMPVKETRNELIEKIRETRWEIEEPREFKDKPVIKTENSYEEIEENAYEKGYMAGEKVKLSEIKGNFDIKEQFEEELSSSGNYVKPNDEEEKALWTHKGHYSEDIEPLPQEIQKTYLRGQDPIGIKNQNTNKANLYAEKKDPHYKEWEKPITHQKPNYLKNQVKSHEDTVKNLEIKPEKYDNYWSDDMEKPNVMAFEGKNEKSKASVKEPPTMNPTDKFVYGKNRDYDMKQSNKVVKPEDKNDKAQQPIYKSTGKTQSYNFEEDSENSSNKLEDYQTNKLKLQIASPNPGSDMDILSSPEYKSENYEKPPYSPENYNFSYKPNPILRRKIKDDMFDMQKISAYTREIKDKNLEIEESSSNKGHDEESLSSKDWKHIEERPNLLGNRNWDEYSKSSEASIESSSLSYKEKINKNKPFYINNTQEADLVSSGDSAKYSRSSVSSYYSHESSSCMCSSNEEISEECSCDCSSRSSCLPHTSRPHYRDSSDDSDSSYGHEENM